MVFLSSCQNRQSQPVTEIFFVAVSLDHVNIEEGKLLFYKKSKRWCKHVTFSHKLCALKLMKGQLTSRAKIKTSPSDTSPRLSRYRTGGEQRSSINDEPEK